MKYWQEERWQKATKQNIPHLYMYTWIRASAWFCVCLNSLLMLFMVEENSKLDQVIPEEKWLFIVMAVLGMLGISIAFGHRKVDRNLRNVIIDSVEIVSCLLLYVFGNTKILFFYLLELIIIIYFAVKIDKDNRIIDNSKFVQWRKQREQKKFDALVKKMKEKNERERK